MDDYYINIMIRASKTPQHEVISECLDYYGVMGIIDLTENQMKEFCETIKADEQYIASKAEVIQNGEDAEKENCIIEKYCMN